MISLSTISRFTIFSEYFILELLGGKNMDYEKIGNFIHLKRKEKGLTQRELAEKIGVTDKAVSKWERGLGAPDISILEILAQSLGISVIEILKGDNILQKDLPDDKMVINVLNYSKEQNKKKIKRMLERVIAFIIIFISVILLILNIESIIRLNKKYEWELDITNDIYIKDQENYSRLKDSINKIKNNQGKFNNIEYQIILSDLTKIEANLLKNKYLNYTGKEYLTKEEVNISFYTEVAGENIIQILFKHDNIDLNLYKDDLHYNGKLINGLNYLNAKELFNSYKYNINSIIIDEFVLFDDYYDLYGRIQLGTETKVNYYLELINLIIKVGEIDE